MTKALALIAALCVVLVPAAEARGPLGKCRVKHGCKRLPGAHRTGSAGVKMVRDWASAPATSASVPVPGIAPAAPTVVPPVAPPSPPPARLGVLAKEFSLVLSRNTLTAGAAIVELQNRGEDAHNLRLSRVDGTGSPIDVPEAESGELSRASTTLSAGEWRLYCTLPGHDDAGMHARLTVTAP